MHYNQYEQIIVCKQKLGLKGNVKRQLLKTSILICRMLFPKILVNQFMGWWAV